MKGDEVIESGDVLIENARIKQVGSAGSIAVDGSVQKMDLKGKTIVPGFVDTHSHMWPAWGIHKNQVWMYAANLAYGVTTTRDPQTATTDVLTYGDMVETGQIIGPRIYSTGPGVGFWAYNIKDFDQAKASEVLMQIQLLYAVDKHCSENNYTADETKNYRQQNAVPILKTLHETLQTQLTNSLPKSPLGMALQYTLARWDKLNVYTLDGNLRIDNNLVENSIRPVAIGRKNYMFAGNHEAAERSAMLYSLFATCKLHHVNPIQWLTYVFENINDQKINNIEQLLPQNYAALMDKK
jgi:hypothetical protein